MFLQSTRQISLSDLGSRVLSSTHPGYQTRKDCLVEHLAIPGLWEHFVGTEVLVPSHHSDSLVVVVLVALEVVEVQDVVVIGVMADKADKVDDLVAGVVLIPNFEGQWTVAAVLRSKIDH